MQIPRGPGGGDPGPEAFVMPAATELGGFFGIGLRADSEQQQQQSARRRFLNLETQLPEEEVVTKLQTEVRQINRIAPRKE